MPERDTLELERVVREFDDWEFDKQRELLERLETAHSRKLNERKRQLEAELKRLSEVEVHVNRGSAKGQKVPVKYRSKIDPSKGWAGRGEKPRWLVDEMAKTKKPLEFFKVSE
jgi:DNA-binding protein H-NS